MLVRFALIMFACLSITGCSGQQTPVVKKTQYTGDFDMLVEAARKVAGTVSDSQSREGHAFTPEIYDVYPDKKAMLIAVNDTSSAGVSTSFAVVNWKQVDGVWRVDSMESEWEEFGMLSIIIEQQIVNKLCRALDDQYKPPTSDPEKSAETFKALMQLIKKSKKERD